MPMIELSDEQVISLLKQLPPARQRAALLTLATGAAQRRDERVRYAENQLRRVSGERGLDWETMSDEDRERFADDLVHEDRECRE